MKYRISTVAALFGLCTLAIPLEAKANVAWDFTLTSFAGELFAPFLAGHLSVNNNAFEAGSLSYSFNYLNPNFFPLVETGDSGFSLSFYQTFDTSFDPTFPLSAGDISLTFDAAGDLNGSASLYENASTDYNFTVTNNSLTGVIASDGSVFGFCNCRGDFAGYWTFLGETHPVPEPSSLILLLSALLLGVGSRYFTNRRISGS